MKTDLHPHDPIPEWRCHLIETRVALTRLAHTTIRRLLPHRTTRVYSGQPTAPYTVEITWTWAGRTISRRRLHAT